VLMVITSRFSYCKESKDSTDTEDSEDTEDTEDSKDSALVHCANKK
jgi:hypothetical protein